MKILVGLHIGNDFFTEANCALLDLNDAAIKHIFKLARKAVKGQIITEFDHTPELGTTELNLEDGTLYKPYEDVAGPLLSKLEPKVVFVSKQGNDMNDPVRCDIVELHVDKDDFWFEGMIKHSDIHWETRMIPLSFLPQELRAEGQSGRKEYKPMTPKETNQLVERIAQGIASGLNAREIADSFNRHVTLEQLVLCIHDLLRK